MQKLIMWILSKTDGFKTILGYLGATFLTDYPMLWESVEQLLVHPDKVDLWLNMIMQLIMATGLVHKFVKELKARKVV